jgi:hypothetical protein
MRIHTHTHTHTHIYIYIYIYIQRFFFSWYIQISVESKVYVCRRVVSFDLLPLLENILTIIFKNIAVLYVWC